jgi:hypothetical protein
MENSENKKILAGNEIKTKKVWKKPELKQLSIRKTFNNPNNSGTDGSLGGAASS